jgi:hypothetical protein
MWIETVGEHPLDVWRVYRMRIYGHDVGWAVQFYRYATDERLLPKHWEIM